VHYSKFFFFANVGRAILGRNFDVNNGRTACEACSATSVGLGLFPTADLIENAQI
jgi:hypothetical protein